ncbi:hypothetical protein SDC9_79307 [bioreactor metagenome]|uniref:Uncharacterized protein n=1 Tax=bioreactor metagenome TaxID=1076179 RepID=A0A644YWA4_9ZZZZ
MQVVFFGNRGQFGAGAVLPRRNGGNLGVGRNFAGESDFGDMHRNIGPAAARPKPDVASHDVEVGSGNGIGFFIRVRIAVGDMRGGLPFLAVLAGIDGQVGNILRRHRDRFQRDIFDQINRAEVEGDVGFVGILAVKGLVGLFRLAVGQHGARFVA